MKKLAIFLLGTTLGGIGATGAIYYTFPFLVPITIEAAQHALMQAQYDEYGDPLGDPMPPLPHHFADPAMDEPAAYAPAPRQVSRPTPARAPKPAAASREVETDPSRYAAIPLPAATPGSCELPAPSDDALMLAVGTYQGNAVNADVTFSTAANGSATWEIDTQITEGDEPLWLVMSAFEPAIWSFDGDLDRIEHVVLVSGVSGAGTAGLPADRVSVLPRDCFEKNRGPVYFTEVSKSWNVLGVVEELAGRTTDTIFGQYNIDAITLPEGVMEEQRPRWNEPPTINYLDPETLVVSEDVTRPDVLPGEAGLHQLIKQGVIEEDTNGHERYKILKQIDALPRGLRGTFVLGKDMTPPKASGFICLTDWRGKPIGQSITCR
jgi:hypothetical protein